MVVLATTSAESRKSSSVELMQINSIIWRRRVGVTTTTRGISLQWALKLREISKAGDRLARPATTFAQRVRESCARRPPGSGWIRPDLAGEQVAGVGWECLRPLFEI